MKKKSLVFLFLLTAQLITGCGGGGDVDKRDNGDDSTSGKVTLYFHAIDQNNNIISGLKVYCFDPSNTQMISAATDSNGDTSIITKKVGVYTIDRILVNKYYYLNPTVQFTNIRADLDNNSIRKYIITIKDSGEVGVVQIDPANPTNPNYIVSGRVTTKDGLVGIQGVSINFGGDYTGNTVTSEDGTWSQEVVGTVTISPAAVGYQFDRTSQTVSQATSGIVFKVNEIDDDFNNVNSLWPNNVNCSYLNGEYQIVARSETGAIPIHPLMKASKRHTIQVNIHSDSSSQPAYYGIYVRYGNKRHYEIQLDPTNHRYRMDPTIIWTPLSTISVGNNMLKVVQDGEKVYVYINDNTSYKEMRILGLLGSYSYEIPLSIGFSVYCCSGSNSAIVHFDNFKLINDVP